MFINLSKLRNKGGKSHSSYKQETGQREGKAFIQGHSHTL